MTVTINLAWDSTGRWHGHIDPSKAELVLTHSGHVERRFVLLDGRPERLGWFRERQGRLHRASVGDAVSYCFCDWEAEQAVVAITRAAAERARTRGADWELPARRLSKQVYGVRDLRRFPTLAFRALWEHATDPQAVGLRTLTVSEAARRAGYRLKDGRADTSRFQRRLGIRGERVGDQARQLSESVNYETALRLCQALERDPVELGL